MRLFLISSLACLAGIGVGFSWPERPVVERSQAVRVTESRSVENAESPASVDAVETLATLFAETKDPIKKEHGLWLATQRMGAADFARLATEWESLVKKVRKDRSMDYESKEDFLKLLAERWAEHDPAAVLALWTKLLKKPDSPDRYPLLQALAARQPEAVLEVALATQDKDAREGIGYTLLRYWGEQNTARARELMARFPEVMQEKLNHAFRAGRAAADPVAGISFAAAEKDEWQRNYLIEAAAKSLVAEGTGAVAQVLKQHPEFSGWAAVSLVERLSERDPRGAAEIIAGSPVERWGSWRVQGIAREFAKQSPADAMAWNENFTGEISLRNQSAIASEWAQKDPQAAMQWFTEHPPSADDLAVMKQNDPRGALFRSWLGTDETAARAWLAAHPDGALAQSARDSLLLHLAYSDRWTEAQKLFDAAPAGQSVNSASTLARSIAERDPVAAADWAAALPPGPTQNAAIEAALGYWQEDDQTAASEWISAFPAGAARDVAMSAFARNLSQKSPTIAAEWVTEIEDPFHRTKAAEWVYGEWSRRSPSAAVAWMRNVPGIHELVRQNLLRYR